MSKKIYAVFSKRGARVDSFTKSKREAVKHAKVLTADQRIPHGAFVVTIAKVGKQIKKSR